MNTEVLFVVYLGSGDLPNGDNKQYIYAHFVNYMGIQHT